MGLQQINHFLLIINSNLGSTTYRSRYFRVQRLKIAIFAHCILIANLYSRKTSGNTNVICTSLKCGLHLVGYNPVADNAGLSSSVYPTLPPKSPKSREIPAKIPAHISSRSSKVNDFGANRKRIIGAYATS